MHRRTVLAAALAAPLGAAGLVDLAAPAFADTTAVIDPRTKRGIWDGWGTSLCWWASQFGNRDDLADLTFSQKTVQWAGTAVPGLGMNIARYNAGACGSNTVNGQKIVYSSRMPAIRKFDGFWLNPSSTDPASSSWQWTGDAKQRAMMTKAHERGAMIELFSNSPMWWMLSNRNPSGATGGGNNLPASNYQRHAIYLSTIAKYARDTWGITFSSVEPFNEPLSGWWKNDGTQEGCHFDSASQIAVINYLRAELNARGLTTMPISASDENNYDLALKSWNALSAAAQRNVGHINVHGYQKATGNRAGLHTAAAGAGKNLWNSEYGETDATGLQAASNIMLDLVQLQPTAWMLWQIVDVRKWGLVDGDVDKGTLGGVLNRHFVLAQFTRHIRPGMQMLSGGQANTVAAYDAIAHKLVIVTLNSGAAQRFTYDLSRFTTVPADGAPVHRWNTNTASGDRYRAYNDTTVKAKRFSTAFAANSIQTFEISGVYL